MDRKAKARPCNRDGPWRLAVPLCLMAQANTCASPRPARAERADAVCLITEQASGGAYLRGV